MALTVRTPPGALPISVEQAQRQAHGVLLGFDDPELDLWESIWIPSVVAEAETFQSRSYITTAYRLTIDWRFPDAICLPRAPVQSVDAVSYVDCDGVNQTLDSADYQFDLGAEPVYIRPAYNKCWPSVRNQLAAIQVDFTAGYGDVAADVPANIRNALLIMAASRYEHREDIVVGASPAKMPKSAYSLLWQDRLFPPGHEYGYEITHSDLYPYLVR